MSVDLVVVGLGYVGLPLAQEATASGLTVVGLDVNGAVVEGLNAGRSHVDDLSDDDIAAMVDRGFRATTDTAVIADADAVVVAVPTPLSGDGGPDLGAVVGSVTSISEHLRRGQLVVLESTTYPGTTEEVVVPILEKSGLRAGADFHVAFSPERIDPGNATFGLRNTPKIVGGIDEASTDAAATLYGKVVDEVVRARGTREAEAAKLLENTYRHINIALMNEMARLFHELDIDLWDVIRLASTKPFGFQAFYPGAGVGGHCIPIDPNYLSHHVQSRLGYPFRFVELAQEINATTPEYVARRTQDLLNDAGLAAKGSTVLLVGVTYKANIADQRESPAVPLAVALEELGANVIFHDAHVPTWSLPSGDKACERDVLEAAAGADAVILVQNHREYDVDAIASASKRLLDTKGVVSPGLAERL